MSTGGNILWQASIVLMASMVSFALLAPAIGAEDLIESARELPLAYDVDVVVAGGSSGAVAAAVAAAEAGATVFLAAPRPYLGEDICGMVLLWLEPGEEPATALAKAVFSEPALAPPVGESLPFTYQSDMASGDIHRDTEPASVLANGQWKNAAQGSVQYAGDVAIVCDLKAAQAVGRVHVMVFQRPNEFEVAEVGVAFSLDGQTWHEAGTIRNGCLGADAYEELALDLAGEMKGEARYVRLAVKKTPAVKRMLLGEIVIEPASATGAAQGAPAPGGRTPPTPMQVKRSLDRALLDAGVDFLYGCYATDVLRDADGRVAGLVIANRAGRQAVRARVIIDATPRATVARQAGAAARPYPQGPQSFTRIVVGGKAHEGEGVAVRALAPVRQGEAGRPTIVQEAFEYTLTLPMADGQFATFAAAEQIARDRTWDPGQVACSETLFQVPPDAIRGVKAFEGAWPGAEAIELDALRPAGVAAVYVLGGCADVSREAAAKLVRPLAYMDLGARVGRAAAADCGSESRPRVVCLGDSITASGYPRQLQRLLGGYAVANAGAGGNTAGQGLTRFDAEVASKKPVAVVILFGTNDSVMDGPKQFKAPVEAYEQVLAQLVWRTRQIGAVPIVCTPPPIQAEAYYARHPREYYEPEGGIDAVLARYREAAARVGGATQSPVVDLAKELAGDPRVLLPDGVHPSEHGKARIAALVAEQVKLIGAPEASRPAVTLPANAEGAPTSEVREELGGPRPISTGEATIAAGARRVPVLGTYDVVVVGGGTGGAPAALSAAREGAKTLVLEYLHGLGGVGTLGLIGSYYHGYRGGFTEEIDKGVASMGPADLATNKHGWNVEWKMEWFRRELGKAGADIWYGALGCGAVVAEGRVAGVVVATPEGRGVVLAKVVIDATGNSDIAAAAGAACVYTDASEIAVQGTGLPPRALGASYTNTDYTFVDDADMLDLWRSFVAAKAKYPNAYDLGQLVDTRERRRIVGETTISPLDIYLERTYPDTIGYSTSDFDSHGFTVHELFALCPPDKKEVKANTPYRSLLPKGLEGVLVIGLGISAHRDAMPILRMQPDIQNQGYAAGLAAAMAAKSGVGLRAIDVKALQQRLVDTKNVPEHVLTDTDSFPIPRERVARAVAGVVENPAEAAVILAQSEEALPMVRAAYGAAAKEAEFGEDALAYAHILGMLGDGTGADTLVRSVASTPWDEGWSFSGMGQFGASMSPVDTRIVALGRTGDKRATAAIVARLNELGPESAFSHHRAVAMGLEALRDPSAAEAIAALLEKPGMTGHAVTSIEAAGEDFQTTDPNVTRDQSLRELILARALYRCGDHEGVGARILHEYAADLRGHYARHAAAVLSERAPGH